MQSSFYLSADYLDIIFSNRNKIYGGYELRKNYNNRAIKSIGFIILFVAIVFLLAFSRSGPIPGIQSKTLPPTVLVEFNPVIDPPKPIAQIPPKATKEAVVKHTILVIEKDESIKEPVVENKDLVDKKIGLENLEGEKSNSIEGTTAKIKGDFIDPPAVIASSPGLSAPVRYVSQMPEFYGDLNEYLGKKLKYPAFAKENDIEGKVSIQFVVNEDGNIADVKILRGIGGGCDEEAVRVVSNMPQWKPGRNNGVPVKVYIILPIVFQLN